MKLESIFRIEIRETIQSSLDVSKVKRKTVKMKQVKLYLQEDMSIPFLSLRGSTEENTGPDVLYTFLKI